MKIDSLNSFKSARKMPLKQNIIENEELKGILLNNYIKNEKIEANSWDNAEFSVNPIIIKEDESNQDNKISKNLFEYKNALKPVLLMGLTGVGALGLISFSLLNYSKNMAKSSGIVRSFDIPRSMNILQEHQLALYRALRQPSAKNMFGFIGVSMMSALTMCSKSVVDGIKEIWVKKQEFDIEHDLNQSLIEVEKNSFKGKLNVVNTMYQNSSNYFKSVFKNDENDASFGISFKGNIKNEKEKEKKDNKKLIFGTAIATLGAIGFSFLLYKNFQKTIGNLETFMEKTTDANIRSEIDAALKIDNKNKTIKKLSDIFKTINAPKADMEEYLNKVKGIKEEEIQAVLDEIEEERIFVPPPEAMAGVAKKIQYYCFMDENTGHLYNWILNPENKFNKYLFLAFVATSAIGYVGKAFVDAIKQVAVQRENSKNELNLRKELVEVEVNNFKAKKEAAINPLLENFKQNLNADANREKLKEQAENILNEIKNGPPYVYS